MQKAPLAIPARRPRPLRFTPLLRLAAMAVRAILRREAAWRMDRRLADLRRDPHLARDIGRDPLPPQPRVDVLW